MKIIKRIYEHVKASTHSEIKRSVKKTLNSPKRIKYYLGSNGIFKSNNQKNIEALYNKHRNERCFIIGSGPSINKMDLSLLKNEITFGHNAFFLISEKIGFLPNYYVVEDFLPAEDNAEKLNSLKGTLKIFAHHLLYCLKPSENTLYPFFDQNYSNPDSDKFPRFSNDASEVIYWGGTVVYMSIQLAFYMGFKQIYLIGVDLDYTVNNEIDNKNIIISDKKDVNHFHPDYFGPGKRWHDPRTDRMQKSFNYAYDYLSQNEVILENATVGGHLKKIPRIDYKSLF